MSYKQSYYALPPVVNIRSIFLNCLLIHNNFRTGALLNFQQQQYDTVEHIMDVFPDLIFIVHDSIFDIEQKKCYVFRADDELAKDLYEQIQDMKTKKLNYSFVLGQFLGYIQPLAKLINTDTTKYYFLGLNVTDTSLSSSLRDNNIPIFSQNVNNNVSFAHIIDMLDHATNIISSNITPQLKTTYKLTNSQ